MALGLALPLLRFVFFPIKAIGRGGNWTLMGAAMLVLAMMGLFLMVKDFGPGDTTAQAAPASTAHAAAPRLSDLAKSF